MKYYTKYVEVLLDGTVMGTYPALELVAEYNEDTESCIVYVTMFEQDEITKVVKTKDEDTAIEMVLEMLEIA